jgi:class II lanthipeptide synthase
VDPVLTTRPQTVPKTAPWVKVAVELAEQIRNAAVTARDGSVVWLQPSVELRGSQPSPLRPLPPHLYGGSTGIALFLAAAERLTRQDGFRDLTLAALAPMRRKIAGLVREPGAADAMKVAVGGFVGLGSFLYGFSCIGELLEEPSLLEEAAAMVSLFTPRRIDADESFDVALGSAGAVLALLALERRFPAAADHCLAAACRCASHLLARRVSHAGSPRAWPPAAGSPPLSGMAHGAAGVCLALLRLYGRTGQPEFYEAALEGLAYERHLYDPEHQNWRDLRVATPEFMWAWCHGAPGIGLARLATLGIVDGPETRADIAAALATTRSIGLEDMDNLCCGNLGRTEILLYAAACLPDPDLAVEAGALASQVVDRAAVAGTFALAPPARSGVPNYSLLTGTAGIGYSLLRLAASGSLPCILLLD